MSIERPDGERVEPPDETRVPVMQEMYDNIWFLFTLSGVIVLVSYIIWALIDLLNIPVAR
jgi:hypothetical protein